MAQSMRKRLRKRRQKRSLRKQMLGGIGGEGSSSEITPSEMGSSSEITSSEMDSSSLMTPSSTPMTTSNMDSSTTMTPGKMDSSTTMTPGKMDSSSPMTPSSTPPKTGLLGALTKSFKEKKEKSLGPGAKLYTPEVKDYDNSLFSNAIRSKTIKSNKTSPNKIRSLFESTKKALPGLSMYTPKKGGRRTQKKRR
jgi:hypothetical protein